MSTIADVRRAILDGSFSSLCGGEPVQDVVLCTLDDGSRVVWQSGVTGRGKYEVAIIVCTPLPEWEWRREWKQKKTPFYEVIWTESEEKDPLPILLLCHMARAAGVIIARYGVGEWRGEDALRQRVADGHYRGWTEIKPSDDDLAKHFRGAGQPEPDERIAWRAWDSPDGTERVYMW